MPDPNSAERFVWKEGDLEFADCATCVHKRGDADTCDAFPKGIPEDILAGEVSHVTAYEGDKGIQYEAELEDEE